jgi:ABC-type Fe3+ transport system permease subunit
MKKLMMLCFVFVFMASFVVAASSEVSTNFIVNDGSEVAADEDFLLEPSFWDSYGNTLIAIVVLIILYVLFKNFSGKKAKGKSRKRK